ncbi:sensor N-terminal transmembrane domain-containing protein [Rhodosalinus sp. 5P4]|uniref:sensor N-terminal transmembrane domain-containing protein n=1 Tax=Rhodosalinus sp. 5P4 TaxID=3239196 RepID=UPI003525D110
MALAEGTGLGQAPKRRDADLVLGEDWVAPDGTLRDTPRERRGLLSLRRSPLTRKIIVFNLIALNILVAGILYLNSSRDSLALQRAAGLVGEVELVADVFEAQLGADGPTSLGGEEGLAPPRTLDGLDLRRGVEVFVFDEAGTPIAHREGQTGSEPLRLLREEAARTVLSDTLSRLWDMLEGAANLVGDAPVVSVEAQLGPAVTAALSGRTVVETATGTTGGSVITVATPVMLDGRAVGVVAMASAAGEIDQMVRAERERVLQMFVVAILVSIGLSLVLASTIANPLHELAAAAEIGDRREHGRMGGPGRVRIPDLTARPDEIGRLSGALRGMVNALYERIDANEQFAADVAHEIKNPLASLRSAVGTLRVASREDHRQKLLDVIDHDVRRLDRLVSDISNASRLDSELVKEEEEAFDLCKMLDNLGQYLGQEARAKNIDFILDLPDEKIIVHGLEARLAQVFVNLITNAISFCQEGDAIRMWARRRDNRVLVVVEDTGPGIPAGAEKMIFKRFYSERPGDDFGNNSGLGLAISEQIVVAHGGVIWAENIRPTEADPTSEPLGARFVVGLPI